jgi:hypothetical protein
MYSQYTLGHRTAHNAGSASFVHAQRGEFSSTNTVLASGDQYFQYQDNPTLGNYIVQNPQQYYSFSQPYLNPYNITPHLNVPQHPPSMEDRSEDCKSPKKFMKLIYFNSYNDRRSYSEWSISECEHFTS